MLQIPNSFKFGKLVSCKKFSWKYIFSGKVGQLLYSFILRPRSSNLGSPGTKYFMAIYTLYISRPRTRFISRYYYVNFFQFSFYLGVCLFKRICASLLNVSVNIHVCLYRIYRSIAISVYVFA